VNGDEIQKMPLYRVSGMGRFGE